MAEIVGSSSAYDLHQKKAVYRRNGIREYLVWIKGGGGEGGGGWTRFHSRFDTLFNGKGKPPNQTAI